jgi:glycosyltransferase involved in cell wall biosynthesis
VDLKKLIEADDRHYMISVAMCTYNGAKYLPRQLESIKQQTLPVDELVVCDDGSTDNTLELLEQFGRTVNFPVIVHRNERNLGSTLNFEKCLSLCQGEILFSCDQDDIWYPEKVKKQVDFLNQHPEVDAVFSNATVVDDDSKPVGRTIWQEIEFTDELQDKWKAGKAYEILFGGFVVTGATLAVRKSILEKLTPFPTHIPKLIHDAWIALYLSLDDKIDFISEPLIYYRVHSSQQVGFGAKMEAVSFKDRMNRDRSEKLKPIQEKADDFQQLYVLLKSLPGINQAKLKSLNLRQQHFAKRATLPANRLLRIVPVLQELLQGRYVYSSKDWWLPVLGDIVE